MFRQRCKLSIVVLILSAVSLFAAQAAAQQRTSIIVSPSGVVAGEGVTVHGNAGACPTGDQVTLLSDAFSSAQQFAGVNPIYATVGSGGDYSTKTQIPPDRSGGLYSVTGRCGGGNIGASAQLMVYVPPASGICPAVVTGTGIAPTVFYTSAERSVWTFPMGGGPGPLYGSPTQVSNGRVIGPVSAIANNGSVIVFGTGTDHALWYATLVGHTWSNWRSLGGIVSDPGAVYRGSPQLYSVYVRGADGAVWSRDHSASGWNVWHKLGGLLYPRTGPAAAYAQGAYVLVVGLDKQLYIAHPKVTGFRPVGARTTASPALTTADGALIGFARGMDNAAWYRLFSADSPGWHSTGGIFTSGLGAANGTVAGPTKPEPATYTVGLGLDSHIWMDACNWHFYPPKFTGWFQPLGFFNG